MPRYRKKIDDGPKQKVTAKKVNKMSKKKKDELDTDKLIEMGSANLIKKYLTDNAKGYDFTNYTEVLRNPDFSRRMELDFVDSGSRYAPGSIQRLVIERAVKKIKGINLLGGSHPLTYKGSELESVTLNFKGPMEKKEMNKPTEWVNDWEEGVDENEPTLFNKKDSGLHVNRTEKAKKYMDLINGAKTDEEKKTVAVKLKRLGNEINLLPKVKEWLNDYNKKNKPKEYDTGLDLHEKEQKFIDETIQNNSTDIYEVDQTENEITDNFDKKTKPLYKLFTSGKALTETQSTDGYTEFIYSLPISKYRRLIGESLRTLKVLLADEGKSNKKEIKEENNKIHDYSVYLRALYNIRNEVVENVKNASIKTDPPSKAKKSQDDDNDNNDNIKEKKVIKTTKVAKMSKEEKEREKEEKKEAKEREKEEKKATKDKKVVNVVNVAKKDIVNDSGPKHNYNYYKNLLKKLETKLKTLKKKSNNELTLDDNEEINDLEFDINEINGIISDNDDDDIINFINGEYDKHDVFYRKKNKGENDYDYFDDMKSRIERKQYILEKKKKLTDADEEMKNDLDNDLNYLERAINKLS